MKKWSFKNTVVAGIFTLLPLVITFYIVKFLYKFVAARLAPVMLDVLSRYNIKQLPEPIMVLISLFIFIILIYCAGLLIQFYIGRLLMRLIEKTVNKIPIVGSIYSAIKQVIDSLNTGSQSFKKVVLVEFPHRGIYSVGFVVRETQPKLVDTLGKECLNVFMPTTPNPTNGFIMVVPKEDCISVNISVDEALKFVISLGIVNFNSAKDAKETLEKAE